MGGSSYIDSVILRDKDANSGWTSRPCAASYDVRGDVDRDADVDSTDKSIAQSNYQGTTSGFNDLTAIGNRKGYAGYEWDGVVSMYHVRHRLLHPVLGRWTRRDPLGYVDGMNVYEYVGGWTTATADPQGLNKEKCDEIPPGSTQCSICGPEIDDWWADELTANYHEVWLNREQGWRHWFTDPFLWHIWQGRVAPGGEWDYKEKSFAWSCVRQNGTYACASPPCEKSAELCGTCVHTGVLGNMNYGFTGRANGFSCTMLLTVGHADKWPWKSDSNCDQASIWAGCVLYDRMKRDGNVNVLPSDVCDVMKEFSLHTLCDRPNCSLCPCDPYFEW
ncbi:MAG: hypothetical protein D8M59_14455 [Planctomycetes bacterium]|nr:hypothetical protein [Planctomycetota bacterium]NOG53313.1 hypothetical protein [Planctomycetota bacterium]